MIDADKLMTTTDIQTVITSLQKVEMNMKGTKATEELILMGGLCTR